MSDTEIPFDAQLLRAAAKELGVLDDIQSLLVTDFKTYQEMAAALHNWAGDGGRSHHLGGNYEPENLILAASLVLGEPSTRHFDCDQQFREAFFHHGDVEIDGSFYTSNAFILTGSLRVKTVLTDCGPDSFIVVGGDVHAEAIHTDGTFFTSGDIHAKQFIYGYYNDNICSASTIHSRLLIEDDHTFDAKFDVEHRFNIDDFDRTDSVFREMLVNECLDETGLSSTKMIKIVKGGGEIFRKAMQ